MTTQNNKFKTFLYRARKIGLILYSSVIQFTTPLMAKLPKIPIKIEKSIDIGIASFYGTVSDGFLGKFTASGIRLTTNTLIVAHRSLPFGTLLKITNLETGACVIAMVADRGPHVRGRLIDVNKPVADKLGITGLTRVEIKKVNYSY